MGLTIHYSLHTAVRKPKKALDLVARLRSRALELPFTRVDDIVQLTGAGCDYRLRRHGDATRQLLVQTSRHVDGTLADGSRWSFSVVPLCVIAFSARPGKVCEESNFGLCSYPASIEIEDPQNHRRRRVNTGLAAGWRWRSSCKTRCTSAEERGGVAHFLRCHLSVVRVLDLAKQLGILSEVNDEGGYWENRDLRALTQTVGQWNAVVARQIGQFKNLLDDSIEAAIAEFADHKGPETNGHCKKTKRG